MAQQPKFIKGHLGGARSLGAGESLITFDNTTGSTETVKREGGKIELAAPVNDRLPMFFTSEAILKNAPLKQSPHEDWAKRPSIGQSLPAERPNASLILALGDRDDVVLHRIAGRLGIRFDHRRAFPGPPA